MNEFIESHLTWLEKTEWVQETATAKELGLHRADVLRMRIENLERKNTMLKHALQEILELNEDGMSSRGVLLAFLEALQIAEETLQEI